MTSLLSQPVIVERESPKSLMESENDDSPEWVRSFRQDHLSSPSHDSDSSEEAAEERAPKKQKTTAEENLVTDTAEEYPAEESLDHPAYEVVDHHDTEEKKPKSKVPSALPLVFPEKIIRAKVLLECEGDALDVTGDIGAVGRISVSGSKEVFLDLKGTIYRTNIIPSNTFFLVNIGASEAKVEAIMNDFVQLKADVTANEMETMIEGTLDDITFDSDGEEKPSAAAAPDENGHQPSNSKKKAESTRPKNPPKARASKATGKTTPKRSSTKTSVPKKRAARKK